MAPTRNPQRGAVRTWGRPAAYPRQQRRRIISRWTAAGAAIGVGGAAGAALSGWGWKLAVALVVVGAIGGAWAGTKRTTKWQVGIRAETRVSRALHASLRRRQQPAQIRWGWHSGHGGDIDAVVSVATNTGSWRNVAVEIKAGDGPVTINNQGGIEIGTRRRRSLGTEPVAQVTDGADRLSRALRRKREDLLPKVGAVIVIAWGSGITETRSQKGQRVWVCGIDRIEEAVHQAAQTASPVNTTSLETSLKMG